MRCGAGLVIVSDSMSLTLDLQLEFGRFALDVDFDIELSGVTGLFGPSGGGKSTLLRVIAGHETRARGKVRFDGSTWQDSSAGLFLPAWRRAVGYVFQDARLFPHLDVAGNLRYAEKRASGEGGDIRFDDVVDAFDLTALMGEHTDTLSGGEVQRVALARTLLTRPRLLLLDEPLAALDRRRKRDILPYLEALPKRFGVPAIYVSHTVGEIARLTENVLVMDGGRLVATGDTATILAGDDPALAALSVETVSVLHVNVSEVLPDQFLIRVTLNDQPMTLPAFADATVGERIRLLIRSGDVVLATREPQGISVRNILRGRIRSVERQASGAFANVAVDVGGARLVARLTQHAIGEMGIKEGDAIYALIKTASFERGS
jgi:molybdate transport system ATP-binding protein